MAFAQCRISGTGNQDLEFTHQIDSTMPIMGDRLDIFSHAVGEDDDADWHHELHANDLTAAQAEQLANAFADFANALHDRETVEHPETTITVTPEPAPALAGGG